MSNDIVWLSEVTYLKLKKELEHRKGEKRDEITERIAAARDEGDLKENGGYHAARDEQGKNEARIVELEYRLAHAKIGTSDSSIESLDSVALGLIITVSINKSNDFIKFILGARENADEIAGVDAFSPSSPLGVAILGAKVGSEVSYKAPNGNDILVEIIAVDKVG
ncbi:MAG: transcription elongation factor GreA [Candidatus Ancillula sp.]|nr:transcription elongation factor GreA [Candidatus Ancillula sp.]